MTFAICTLLSRFFVTFDTSLLLWTQFWVMKDINYHFFSLNQFHLDLPSSKTILFAENTVGICLVLFLAM